MAKLEGVRPGNEANLPAWTTEIQVDFMGKPAASWRYQMSAPILMSSWELKAEGSEHHYVGMKGWA